MKRALVLSSGAAWGAFHIGALDYLVAEREYKFDLCAGTGIGAMNAAFVACGEYPALNEFWNHIGWLKLLSFNWRHPLKEAPFLGKPQREFIQQHISVDKLEERNCKLVFSALNLSNGEQIHFSYPGSNVPLMEALMGAVTVPGLTPAFSHDKGPLVEGTFVNSFILDHIITNYEAEEYYGVAVLPVGANEHDKEQQYTNWRQVATRTLQINLSRDIHKGISNGQHKLQTIHAYQQMRENLQSKIEDKIIDAGDRKTIMDQLHKHYENSENKLIRKRDSKLYKIISENEVEEPLWSFRKKNMRALMNKGYRSAKKSVS